MTPVLFHFVTALGDPIALQAFKIRLSRSDYDEDISGIIMPRLIEATTDVDGKATVELMPCSSLYHVTVYDTVTDVALHYDFYVPVLGVGVPNIRLQDIIVTNTANLEPNVAVTLQALIIDEEIAREAAITTVTTSITTETSNRVTAITALQTSIVGLGTSTTADINAAVTGLQSSIITEVTNRTNADTALQTSITTEITNRTAADTALQASITAEASTRTTAINTLDTTVTTNLATEVTNRTAAVSTVQTSLNTLSATVSAEAAELDALQITVSTLGSTLGSSTIIAVPNATTNIAKLSPTGANTNYDIAIVPKGNGAFLTQVPDNLTAGGNKRGTNSIDLQTLRASATSVAGGSRAVICGGYNNRCDGIDSSIVGGQSNYITGSTGNSIGGGQANNIGNHSYATIAGGYLNTTTGAYAFIGGGAGNSCGEYAAIGGGAYNIIPLAAQFATIGGGYQNQANGIKSTIPGGSDATTRSITGAYAYSSGMFATKGDSQLGVYVLRATTTNATPTVLTTTNTAATSINTITLPNNATYKFTGEVSARNTANGDSAGFTFSGLIKRGATAAATVLVATVTPTVITDAGASAWTVTVTADSTLGALKVEVVGAASTNVRWVAEINTVEVTN